MWLGRITDMIFLSSARLGEPKARFTQPRTDIFLEICRKASASLRNLQRHGVPLTLHKLAEEWRHWKERGRKRKEFLNGHNSAATLD